MMHRIAFYAIVILLAKHCQWQSLQALVTADTAAQYAGGIPSWFKEVVLATRTASLRGSLVGGGLGVAGPTVVRKSSWQWQGRGWTHGGMP